MVHIKFVKVVAKDESDTIFMAHGVDVGKLLPVDADRKFFDSLTF